MEGALNQPRRKRARVSEIGGTAAPGWPAEAVRTPEQGTGSSNPTFPSHQIDRSHQVADADALMNGYSTPHSQYPNPPSQLSQAPPPPDVVGLNTPPAHSHSQAQQQQQQAAQQQQQQQQQAQQQQSQPQPQSQQQQGQQQQQQRGAGPISNTDRVLYYSGSSTAPATAAAAVAAAAAVTPTIPQSYNLSGSWATPTPTGSGNPMPQSPLPGPGLAPPPEGIYRTFEDLLTAVQRVAKDQGYGVVKLRASNYRDGKPTRYDLVCDRGGVKYNSTAKKRNPSTRKVDCPWRAKAVCEVQLGNQWRFGVQESRHNHEPRLPAAVPGQENTPMAQSIRSLTNKIDRIGHDMAQGFNRIEATLAARLESVEKRIDALEGGRGPGILGGPGGTPSMGTPSMPPANMGGPGLGNGALTNGGMGNGGMGNGMGSGGMVDNRLSSIEARVSAMEQQRNGMEMGIMDEESRQLASMVM